MLFSVEFWQLLVVSALVVTGATIITLLVLFIVEFKRGTLW